MVTSNALCFLLDNRRIFLCRGPLSPMLLVPQMDTTLHMPGQMLVPLETMLTHLTLKPPLTMGRLVSGEIARVAARVRTQIAMERFLAGVGTFMCDYERQRQLSLAGVGGSYSRSLSRQTCSRNICTYTVFRQCAFAYGLRG